jgi:hypothetical protein
MVLMQSSSQAVIVQSAAVAVPALWAVGHSVLPAAARALLRLLLRSRRLVRRSGRLLVWAQSSVLAGRAAQPLAVVATHRQQVAMA